MKETHTESKYNRNGEKTSEKMFKTKKTLKKFGLKKPITIRITPKNKEDKRQYKLK